MRCLSSLLALLLFSILAITLPVQGIASAAMAADCCLDGKMPMPTSMPPPAQLPAQMHADHGHRHTSASTARNRLVTGHQTTDVCAAANAQHAPGNMTGMDDMSDCHCAACHAGVASMPPTPTHAGPSRIAGTLPPIPAGFPASAVPSTLERPPRAVT